MTTFSVVVFWLVVAAAIAMLVRDVFQHRKARLEHRAFLASLGNDLHNDANVVRAEFKKTRHVLFVDDDPVIRGVLAMLEDYGIKVDIATSAEEAVQRLGANGYDAVVVDAVLQWGQTQGLELCDQVRREHPEIRRVLYSARIPPDQVVAAFNRGSIHRFIAKPWDNERLVDVLNECTAERRSSTLFRRRATV